ncbi:MAG: hypothetical protein CMJ46_05315 [Planctomyces sp.]|nr:hypothetical protein [Planctomyces sp.]
MTDNNHSDEARKRIGAECFKKGSQAAESKNWDYAIEMLRTSVKMVPENVFYRQVLRGAEERKYGDNKKGKRLAGFSITKLKASIKAQRMKSNWAAVDQTAEEGLALNPWDTGLNAALGEAASKRGYSEVAQFAFEKALKIDPDNRDLLVGLADVFENRGSYLEAAQIWNQIQRLNPQDSKARMKANQLSANSTMAKGGYEDAERSQDVRQVNAYDQDRPVKRDLPEQVTGPGLDQEADLRRAIRKNPEDRAVYMKLAGFLRDQKRAGEAFNELKAVEEKFGNEGTFRELFEDIELQARADDIEAARLATQANPDDDKAKKRHQSLVKDHILREIDILKRRMTENPKDLGLKFRLAKNLMKFKKWPEAIPLLQQASSGDQKNQADILVHLGKCYHAEGRKELALRQFEKAVPMIDQHERPHMFVEAHYFCGRMCEEAGKKELAENHYLDVISVDYEFKDARERLDKLGAAAEED